MGYAPIGALCISLFGILPLHLGTRFLVLPAALVCMVTAIASPAWGRRALAGFLAGVVATAAYDATRLALVWAGVWPDFIPPIGRLALMDQAASPIWGYAWRFLGNGGGMGLTFAMLPWRGTRAGMLYGAFVCCCLYLTLLFAPHAQETMFRLTPLTAAAAMIGHLDYGLVLGWLLTRWLPKLAPTELVMVIAEVVPAEDPTSARS
ncbi:MAG: hypothetical protein JWM80_1801 [Cyanobacteria bacterium RYN_339]|nr:hypothetical protein [Cyanobacteria bacterium RYN_339]